ncbi:Gfo/Idh/MocA family protein [Promethearchaeum syntrophicum]|uniref:Gfo/Idh/MocA family protein n=1 Tax=Promethearchaeum syntrophicum TaxID=2594042 RepID=A0A5B9D660_9ARCH|nr:Gfo/Idh/MocA family oxidoreductase [Candidatus Prometheoarchaeum syntrophicum]QEE14609.1 putative oxidoreductase [Candidatus Prometheoarchaeum syntrophicum]
MNSEDKNNSARKVAEAMVDNMQANQQNPNFDDEKERSFQEARDKVFANRKIINIGIIGCGGIAKNHAFSISLLENNARKIWKWKESKQKIKPVLYALADIEGSKAEEFAQHFPAKKIYKGANAGNELIDDPDVDAVFILVPTVDHLGYVLRAAEKGKHIMLEKPAAFSPDDIRKMIEARDKHKVVLQVGLVMRSSSPIYYLKKLLSDNKEKWGSLTNIVYSDSQQKPYTNDPTHPSTWRRDKNKAHAGVLFEHDIHDLDGMISILGKVDEVYAKIKYFAGYAGIEDSVAALVTFKNGVTFSMNCMWNDLNYDCRKYEIFFEKAKIRIIADGRDEKLAEVFVQYLDEPEYEIEMKTMDDYFFKQIGMPHVKAEIPGPYYAEDLRFIMAIVENNIESEIKAEYGKYVQEVIEAIYHSNEIGNVVKIREKLL